MGTNISYFLAPYGWSVCWFYKDGRSYEVNISHSFGDDPMVVCMQSLMKIMKGDKSTSFVWYGEPGGNLVILNEIENLSKDVYIKVIDIEVNYGQELNFEELAKGRAELEFQINKIQLVRMLYYEFKKIFELMKGKEFSLTRKDEFPFKEFDEFEKTALEYII
ncbi:hypothetical protein [Psychrobacter glacincola]|uniref:Uncharacterized protein n=1 Tax=Psychrobacter glacincola TaxID=56810 RepID=A0ABW1W8T9_9GAMM|nr:hypothetical protein [Psychrobacter glacincola]